MNEDKDRLFIITLGRTGSSLLASIISDASVDFGVKDKSQWDPSGGAFEHPALGPIVSGFEYMDTLGYQRPTRLIDRMRWSIVRHQAKAKLKLS